MGTGLGLKIIKCDHCCCLWNLQWISWSKSQRHTRVTHIFCSSCWKPVLSRCPHPEAAAVPIPQLLYAPSITCSALKRPASCKSRKKPGNFVSSHDSELPSESRKKRNKWTAWQEKWHQSWGEARSVMSACLVCRSPGTQVLEDLWSFSRLWLKQCSRISWSLSTPCLTCLGGRTSLCTQLCWGMDVLLARALCKCHSFSWELLHGDSSKDELSLKICF